MGIASNEKLQRMTQLEKAIEWHEEQHTANAARGAAPAAPAVKVKNLGALRVRGSGTEIVTAGARVDSGLGERRPQDSVYYHPTLNPTGRPPPGKPQKYKATAGAYDDDDVAGEEDDDEDDERAARYEVVSCAPVDMFPHTPHVETVAVLRRVDEEA